jgi:hypothetical protein
MTPSWCSIHEIDFMSCPCPDRRRTDRLGDLVLVCRICKVHCSRHDDVACPNPDYDIREAV